jgi:hypothetical protein
LKQKTLISLIAGITLSVSILSFFYWQENNNPRASQEIANNNISDEKPQIATDFDFQPEGQPRHSQVTDQDREEKTSSNSDFELAADSNATKGLIGQNLPAATSDERLGEAAINPYSQSSQAEASGCEIKADISAMPSEAIKIFYRVVDAYGCEKFASFTQFEIYDNDDMPRALAGATSLRIRSDVLADLAEFESLMVHELAHIVDLGYFRGSASSGESFFKDGSLPIYKNDPSLEFYKLTWLNSSRMNSGTKIYAFVSRYGQTNPFEDFAETAVMYVEQNRDFQVLAKTDPTLALKYDFMRDQVFAGKIFATGDGEVDDVKERIWDTTRYDL